MHLLVNPEVISVTKLEWLVAEARGDRDWGVGGGLAGVHFRLIVPVFLAPCHLYAYHRRTVLTAMNRPLCHLNLD